MASRLTAVIILAFMAGACGLLSFSGDAEDTDADDAASMLSTANLNIVDRFHYCADLYSDGVITCIGSNSGGQANPPIREGAHPIPNGAFVDVSNGWGHSCGLLTSDPGLHPDLHKAIVCWGSNFNPTQNQQGEVRWKGPYAAVAAGGFHACGLRESGEAHCWGSNTHGQADAPEYTEESPEGPFEAVAAGGFHTCGLRESGGVLCWGSNEYGQSDAPEGPFEAVAAGGFHTCGLRESGGVLCWGSNEYGQSDAPEGPFEAVASGVFHSCGLRESGGALCWGSNEHGQTEAPPGSFVSVSASGRRSCGRVTEAEGGTRTECWGALGLDVAEIEAGSWHYCQLGGYSEDSDPKGGEVICVGDNTYGQVDAPAGFYTDISANVLNSCAVRADGAIVCWGEISDNDSTPGAKEKTEIKLLSGSEGPTYAIAMGLGYSCATTRDGASVEVECWDENNESSKPPDDIVEVLSQSSDTFLAVATGRGHSCALAANDAALAITAEGDRIRRGSAFCWNAGTPKPGGTDLGYNVKDNSYTAISSGWSHSCGLRFDGTVECWGKLEETSTIPLWDENTSPDLWNAVPSGTFTAIASGGMHACALSINHTVKCWGDDYDGQTDAPAATAFKAISSGAFHSCGLVRADRNTGAVTHEDREADGTIRCWGRNAYGQTDAPEGKFRAIASSGRQSCALPEDSRTAVCWGQTAR